MPQGIIVASAILIIFIILYMYFNRSTTETFRITTAPRPKTFGDLMTGVPLDAAYNDEIFEERNCSGAPGLDYVL